MVHNHNLHVRLSEDLVEALTDYRQRFYELTDLRITQSEAVRMLLREALKPKEVAHEG